MQFNTYLCDANIGKLFETANPNHDFIKIFKINRICCLKSQFGQFFPQPFHHVIHQRNDNQRKQHGTYHSSDEHP
jgi:hypothetical protein